MIENVYLKEKAAKSFEQSAQIPHDSFVEIADYLYKYLEKKDNISILDLGSGTGRTVINISERLEKFTNNIQVDCVEVSQNMINEFKKKTFNIRNIHMHKFDLNSSIKRMELFETYDLIIILSVLQYLNNWKLTLQDVEDKMNEDSIFVQGELSGWFQLLDGKFSHCLREDIFHKFWRKYFNLRAQYSEWNPEVKFSNMSKAYNYCIQHLKMCKIDKKNFSWQIEVSWKQILSWIAYGALSSLGSGLKLKDRLNLESAMKRYLENNDIDINDFFFIEWGIEFSIFKRSL